MAHLMSPNGQVTEVHPAEGTMFTLEEMQALVEGYVFPISVEGKTYVALVDEDALVKNPTPAYNLLASVLVGQPLYGPVLLGHRGKELDV